jgi:hypothetical protein
MTIAIGRSGAIAMCAASAAIGGVLTMSAVSVATTPNQSPKVPSVASTHYLHGAYVLTDGKCPKGTVNANATVRASTNATSGHSTFPLCYVK